jgi:hypothetical protein
MVAGVSFYQPIRYSIEMKTLFLIFIIAILATATVIYITNTPPTKAPLENEQTVTNEQLIDPVEEVSISNNHFLIQPVAAEALNFLEGEPGVYVHPVSDSYPGYEILVPLYNESIEFCDQYEFTEAVLNWPAGYEIQCSQYGWEVYNELAIRNANTNEIMHAYQLTENMSLINQEYGILGGGMGISSSNGPNTIGLSTHNWSTTSPHGQAGQRKSYIINLETGEISVRE